MQEVYAYKKDTELVTGLSSEISEVALIAKKGKAYSKW